MIHFKSYFQNIFSEQFIIYSERLTIFATRLLPVAGRHAATAIRLSHRMAMCYVIRLLHERMSALAKDFIANNKGNKKNRIIRLIILK